MNDYEALLTELKVKIRTAQVKASLSVNKELIKLYFEIGGLIHKKQKLEKWGQSVVEKLSKDLRNEFPQSKGLSARNLWNMKMFYEEYADQKILQQLVAEIPWGHNMVLMSAVKDKKVRQWHINQAVEYGWSRSILSHQIETDLYKRQTKKEKTNNFALTLDSTQSELVQ